MSSSIFEAKNVKRLLNLTLPIVLSQLAQASLGFVDSIMVGRLGTDELAAISISSSVYITVFVLMSGPLFAVSPLVSFAYGANDNKEVSRLVRQGLWMSILLAPLASLIIYLIGSNLEVLGQSPEVSRLGLEYLSILAFVCIPQFLISTLRAWFESLGRPVVVTIAIIASVLVNFLCNYALIYGNWGFPALGLQGAAIASVTSSVVVCLFLLVYAFLHIQMRQYHVFDKLRKPNVQTMINMCKIGVPVGINIGVEIGLFTATAFLVGAISSTALAAHQIAIQLASISFMVPLSIGIAASIRVGNCLGAEEPDLARNSGWLAIVLGTLFMCFSAAAYIAFPNFFVSIFLGEFNSSNHAVASLAIDLLFLAGLFQIFDGIQATAAGALRGLKDTVKPMLISVFSYWIVGLGLGYYLSESLQAKGLWIGLVVGLMCSSIMLTIRWARKTKKIS